MSKAKQFVLIGNPVSHSLSPALFWHWFAEHGIDAEYRAVETGETGLSGIVGKIRAGGLAGANVTIPLKEAVARLADSLDLAAKATGAVNTLVALDGGEVEGRNTDAGGLLEALKEEAPGWPCQAPACVFGSGGAARAVVYALESRGVPEIRLTARNRKAAARIKKSFPGAQIRLFPWENRGEAASGAGLLVNATPLGMRGFPPLDAPISPAITDAVAFDLVYNPHATRFLADCAAWGFSTVGGLSMLLHQGALAFQAWFGFRPEITEEMRAKLESAVASREQNT